MPLQPRPLNAISVFEKQGDVVHEGLNNLVKDKSIYEHQAEAVGAIWKDLLEKKIDLQTTDEYGHVSLAVLPTGTGKTGIGVLAAYVCKAKKVLVVTPSEAISKQQFAQFKPVEGALTRPFIEERGIFTSANEKDWVPLTECVLHTKDLEKVVDRIELVITNAHKFSSDGKKGVDITKFPCDNFSLIIVDEAHHFPAKTWRNIVDHFCGCQILFLTATPYNRGKYILNFPPCYVYEHQKAVEDGIIRETDFIEANGSMEFEQKDGCYYSESDCIIMSVLDEVKTTLNKHDTLDQRHVHKAMVLARNKDNARRIAQLWNSHYDINYKSDEHYDTHQEKTWECITYIQSDKKRRVEDFKNNNAVKVMVVIFRLTEGFDCKQVSVTAILRNVNKKSRVYFAQFVGRGIRKLHRKDPVKATVISHVSYSQQPNYEAFIETTLAQDEDEDESIASEDNIEDEVDE